MRFHSLIGASALCALASATPQASRGTLVDAVVGDPQLQTLEAAVKAAGLVEALAGKGPFTVLAPTNEAFAALDPHVLGDLLKPENKAALTSILLYHVVPGRLEYGELAQRRSLATLNGQRIEIGRDGATATVDGAGFGTINLAASNGYVQVIDKVLLPANETLVELAAAKGNFKTLLAAAQAAGLADVLQTGGPFTVLAPTDAAFAKLGKDTLASLLEPGNKDKLARILKFHVLPGRLYARDAIQAGRAETLAGELLEFRIENGRLEVGGTRVVANDLQAANGVIHVIESVLLPPAPPAPRGNLIIGYNSTRPSAALAYQLQIDRNSSIVVTNVTRPKSGLEEYDVITHINGEPYSGERIDAAKQSAGYQGTVSLTLIRKGETLHLDAPVDIDPH